MDWNREREVAAAAAAAGAAIVRAALGRSVGFRRKADSSPVTEVDLAAERVIRDAIALAFPDDAVLGEEFGKSEGKSGRTWVVDPLDGTKNFLRGLPFCSTQVALHDGHAFVVGASAAASSLEIAIAALGHGATLDDAPIHVSAVDRLEAASISLGNVKSLAASPRWGALARLVRTVDRVRGYGDFFHYHALAAGKVDAVIESDVSIHDVAALSVIVEEAGGRVTMLEGGPLGFESTSILATNGRLHDAVSEVLASEAR